MVISEFNPATGILESSFEGDVSLNEILEYIIATKKNKSFPRNLKIRTDSSKAVFDFSIHDLNAIIIENEKSLKKYDSITDAIIVSDPKTTALAMLFQELEKNPKYKFEIFSTKEAAEDWLSQV
ncbi:hypothetical protein L3073_17965 [Ancylomarina sp. DW003]|nr:hypothetical protein [Ancylomarina sp. DW003]MDE5424104.1 hypothetical protein [Ancylomarina sp. DW003]